MYITMTGYVLFAITITAAQFVTWRALYTLSTRIDSVHRWQRHHAATIAAHSLKLNGVPTDLTPLVAHGPYSDMH